MIKRAPHQRGARNWLVLALLAGMAVHAQTITGIEYFFDSDPGVGNGTFVVLPEADVVEEVVDVPATGLAPGWHTLYARCFDSTDRWGIRVAGQFYVQPTVVPHPVAELQDGEYFFDEDPGVGNGSLFTLAPGRDNVTVVEAPTTGLGAGWHRIYLRVRDADGKWSTANTGRFYLQPDVVPPGPAQIVAIEWFVDEESGVGLGREITFAAVDQVDRDFDFDMSGVGLDENPHLLHVRFLDDRGNYGLRTAVPFNAFDAEFHTVEFQVERYGVIVGKLNQLIRAGTPSEQVEAVPDYDEVFVFTGWSGGYNGIDNPLIIPSVDEDLVVTATFANRFKYTQEEYDNAPGPDRDGDGFTDVQEGSGSGNADPDRYIINIKAGWNQVSIARVPDNHGVQDLFPFRIGQVYVYDTVSRTYKVATLVLPLRGHWVYSDQPYTIEILLPGTITITAPP